jgi:hypothetical protein
MVTIVEFKGKGKGSKADSFKILQFSSKGEAEGYIKAHEDLESKYWTAYEYIEVGVEYDVYFLNDNYN